MNTAGAELPKGCTSVDTPNLTCLSLCSGAAGLELGLSLTVPKLCVLGYVERDSYATACLLARMEDKALAPAPIFCGDLADFDARDFAGVDCLTVGWPCQPFSTAARGRQRGIDLWPEILRVIYECGPWLVFAENVVGAPWEKTISDLERPGYRVETDTFCPSELGAPHRRPRRFLLAAHADRESESLGALHAEMACLSKAPANCWHTAPMDLRVAHGMAHRMEQFRVIGNGVVPAVAARAWTTLMERLMQ